MLLEFLGRNVDMRKALAQSGLFELQDPRLPAYVLEAISNEIPPGSFVLEVEEP